MKRLATAVGFVLLSLGLNASAEERMVNFSGKWVFNKEKSDPTSRVTTIGQAAGPKAPIKRIPGSKLPPGRRPGSKTPAGSPPAVGAAVRKPNVMRGRGFGGTFDGTIPIAIDVPLVITQTATEMHIANALKINGKNVPNKEIYKLDGEKHQVTIQDNSGTEVKREIKASLKKDKIIIEVITNTPNRGRFRTTREFALSEDGRTLTVKASSQSPYLLSSQKLVYDKN